MNICQLAVHIPWEYCILWNFHLAPFCPSVTIQYTNVSSAAITHKSFKAKILNGLPMRVILFSPVYSPQNGVWNSQLQACTGWMGNQDTPNYPVGPTMPSPQSVPLSHRPYNLQTDALMAHTARCSFQDSTVLSLKDPKHQQQNLKKRINK